ncbi:Type IV leader peptidase family protein [Rosistilla oblonga]|uniref:Type IV leader peptidase family protein n=1 Tax=Rosistilla oblonga TaxID=2527990 RepID=A0A518IVJ5_9BACT|nr:prepilin peptidase [Rosistilla oblonga]QDV14746.1 Type IV leader peptidase family protein [Rosistilla oblonga]QDV57108.1 Type IV leader peptidase family protein [Rosistilla oblonga]
MDTNTLIESLMYNWHVWLVAVVMIVAAVIDGMILKVPNWLTYPFIISGWVYAAMASGWNGLGYSLLGTFVGMMLLLVVRAVGGMGAGDVKLLAGLGAWMGASTAWWAFVWTTVVGGIIAVIMIAMSGNWFKHYAMFHQIIQEFVTIRNPEKLAAIARERKPTMKLLPYGIPMAIGSILYFAYAGMFV